MSALGTEMSRVNAKGETFIYIVGKSSGCNIVRRQDEHGCTATDLMVAASSGGIDNAGDPPSLITPGDSPNPDIRAAYQFLMDNYHDGSKLDMSKADCRAGFANCQVTATGHPLDNEQPLIGTERVLMDPRLYMETVNWQLVVTIPDTEIYGYVWDLMYATISFSGILLALLCWESTLIANDAPEAARGGFAASLIVVFGLHLLWQMVVRAASPVCGLDMTAWWWQVKHHTDSLIDDVLQEGAKM